VLSISFINTALNSWFSDDFGDAMKGGLAIALAYNDGTIKNLEAITESSVFSSVFREVGRSPEWTFDVIRRANSQIHSMQVFVAKTGVEYFFCRGSTYIRQETMPRELWIGRASATYHERYDNCDTCHQTGEYG
jgi:nitrogen fixation/metabolism regulation signal transduction histidine kinase